LPPAGTSDEAPELREDRYAIAVGVANLQLREEKLEKAYAAYEQTANGREEPERPMSDAQTRRALAEHARGRADAAAGVRSTAGRRRRARDGRGGIA
jgi:hypothetical protein